MCGCWRTRCSRRRRADPIDFEATVERTLLQWHKGFTLRKVLFDPFQMAAVAQRVAKAGVRIEEFAQTVPNLTAATSNLFDLIQARQLVLYPDAGMRLAISRAGLVETSRGQRLEKTKQAHQIDVIVALSMAALAAVQGQGERSFDASLAWVHGGDDTDAALDPHAVVSDYASARQRMYRELAQAYHANRALWR